MTSCSEEESYHEEAFNCSSSTFTPYYDLPPTADPSSQSDEEDFLEVPLSPDSRKYQLKMELLTEKYDEIHSFNEVLKNRLLQVKKEITQHQWMKRVLVNKLESLGDNYYNKVLELPELIETPKRAPTVEEVEREKKRRERKERDRVREKARKAAKREADRKAKLALSGKTPEEIQKTLQPKQPNPKNTVTPFSLNGVKKEIENLN